MAQQTAVSWLIEQLYSHSGHIDVLDVATLNNYWEQAKQMEKGQIILAATEMKREVIGNTLFNKEMKFQNGEEYYKEKFGKE